MEGGGRARAAGLKGSASFTARPRSTNIQYLPAAAAQCWADKEASNSSRIRPEGFPHWTHGMMGYTVSAGPVYLFNITWPGKWKLTFVQNMMEKKTARGRDATYSYFNLCNHFDSFVDALVGLCLSLHQHDLEWSYTPNSTQRSSLELTPNTLRLLYKSNLDLS